MPDDVFDPLRARLRDIRPARSVGQITALGRDHVRVTGLDRIAALGDRVRIGDALVGEVLRIDAQGCTVMPEGAPDGIRLGQPVTHLGPASLSPHPGWLGRVIDPDGRPLDERPLFPGPRAVPLLAPPPPPAQRRGLGQRLRTGFAVFDTLLPIVRGQRVGLFAGSGVGKSHLIAGLAQGIAADVVVIGLIGERGREVRDFVAETLGAGGLARAVVVVATSDQPALTRARAAWAMMSVAEYFRDRGLHVLVLADSITRFAEAQREVAAAVGEPFGPSGFPASMAQMVMALAERAGPGGAGQGDITAVLSVLVAGSDMEGPVADVMRGVLDGHVLLSRDIAERGRYPAIDLLRSVSRALPGAASVEEGKLIQRARQLLGAHDRTEMMIQAGLYAAGSDPVTDAAIAVWPALDAFVAAQGGAIPEESFVHLRGILDAVDPDRRGTRAARAVFEDRPAPVRAAPGSP
ncbi:FliI/YscN family ATPase [Roseicyclus mahoneyensis]|uniref:Flagellum-specific ATP synthase n=1 Tax=Roseicyclus mahoneyensis TaxID=164332 RepID=A0A316GXH6_9RHOB|nr:FliI/YscN family ATPase [Roseicyclus mahoneyensis]PWK59793.1 flagellum-specific ATP synthase [Roseicyclus mahoneyensis]